ncbi:hypothetical protein BDU57DRAFT_468162 [Ampelomyces quisqualis]|uniref:Uncharacterized protein n=1 Tax=Ampelomyces quisqualis TaxID=50730 RepID=A0A6A5QTL7_AMPQU|nr:hypothetical protein BDU57DRAFT_468162 [Ampelomyces quisqualis]
MSTLPTTFAHHDDLTPLLDELATQASAVLASVFVVGNVHDKYIKETDPTKQSEYRIVLKEHGAALETDLSIIRLNAEFITDERLEEWVDVPGSAAGRAGRRLQLQALTEKMEGLQGAMAGLWDGVLSVEDNSE